MIQKKNQRPRGSPAPTWTPDLWQSRPTRERGNCLINATETIRYSCGKNEIEFQPQIINKSHLWKTGGRVFLCPSCGGEACLSKPGRGPAVKHKTDKSHYVNRQTLLTQKNQQKWGRGGSEEASSSGLGRRSVCKELAEPEGGPGFSQQAPLKKLDLVAPACNPSAAEGAWRRRSRGGGVAEIVKSMRSGWSERPCFKK